MYERLINVKRKSVSGATPVKAWQRIEYGDNTLRNYSTFMSPWIVIFLIANGLPQQAHPLQRVGNRVPRQTAQATMTASPDDARTFPGA